MQTSDFDFQLPPDLIAQEPSARRDASRMLVYDTGGNSVRHQHFFEIEEYFSAGDVLVVNSSRVIPARIIFFDEGREREIFVLEQCGEGMCYEAMVRPGKAFYPGAVFQLADGISCEVVEVMADGTRRIVFVSELSFEEILGSIGRVPLPPYIHNNDIGMERYQTVYASDAGSVAAPTAGLHFTEELLSRLRQRGVNVVEVVLHVGRGTFMPVTAPRLEEHVMHRETYTISAKSARDLNCAMAERRRIVAVGTTSVRVLESAFLPESEFSAGHGSTTLFIRPGVHKWQVVDALITNFHLPKSTLLMLVASFLEHKGVQDPVGTLHCLYAEAIKERYRFFSFGDAMFLY